MLRKLVKIQRDLKRQTCGSTDAKNNMDWKQEKTEALSKIENQRRRLLTIRKWQLIHKENYPGESNSPKTANRNRRKQQMTYVTKLFV